jgi:predicted transcriptional regulator
MNFKKILNCLCNSFNFEDYECNDNNKKEVGKIFKIERGILKHNKKGLYEKIKKKIFEKARQHENYKFSLEYLQNKIEETLKKFS